MRVSTTQVLQEQVREIPVRHKLDIVHPASKQGKTQVQPDSLLVLAGFNHETRCSSHQATAYRPEAVPE